MPQRKLLLSTAALTVFILIVAAAVMAQLAPPSLTPAAPAALPSDPTILIAELQQREAAYQTALAEANQRIEQANAQLATQASGATTPPLATPSAANPAAQTSGATTPPSPTPSADDAAAIAIRYRNGGSVAKVELNEERGLWVYEVKFTDGGEVYVDATTGKVVYAKLADTTNLDDDADDNDDDDDDDDDDD